MLHKPPCDEHHKEKGDHNLRQPVRYGNAQGDFRGEVSPQDGKAKNPSGVGECSDNSGNAATSCCFEGKSGTYPDEYSRDDSDEGVAKKGDGRGEEAVEPENTPTNAPTRGPSRTPVRIAGMCMMVARPAGVGTGTKPSPVAPRTMATAARRAETTMSFVFNVFTSVPVPFWDTRRSTE